MRILGISAFYHDSASALIVDGKTVAAAQEERFSRIKHDPTFPKCSIKYCLAEGETTLSEIDYVAFYDKPFLTFERLLETYLAFAPRGILSFAKSMPLWLREKLFQKNELRNNLRSIDPDFDAQKKLLFAEHHQSHAASAFFASPFNNAAVLTLDGVGEWTTTSVKQGAGANLTPIKEIHFPHSLGLLYSAFTYYLGFKVNSGEYKVMGLAPYGEPLYIQKILDNVIDVKEDGSFRLDMSYFNYCTGLTMVNENFEKLFGRPTRNPEAFLDKFHMDVAASVQAVTEEIILKLTRDLAAKTGEKNLCLAGGVALNCVANGKILQNGAFERIWVQPAAGDAGGAIGAALTAYHQHAKKNRKVSPVSDGMTGSYLGPSFTPEDVKRRLERSGAHFTVMDEDDLLETTVQFLTDGLAVGWFQGRMEFGPRALGARSILGDPRSPEMQKSMNLKIKYRESFRPFAPAILAEELQNWFELKSESPYMLFTAEVAKRHRIEMTAAERELFGIDRLNIMRSSIPAVTHVDYSARIQTVHNDTNPKFYSLLKAFQEATDCPILLNTSFNVRSEPIVCTPEDAFRCFMGTGIELLVVENCVLRKLDQDATIKKNYAAEFAPD